MSSRTPHPTQASHEATLSGRTRSGWQALLFLALTAVPAAAQFTYPGCAPVQASDFTVTPLALNSTHSDLQEPIMMALHPSPQGAVDIYFTQRYGKVRLYNGDSKTLTTLVDLGIRDSIDGTNSEGLIGIALDPGFKTNGWVYLFIGIERVWRLSRYTLSGDRINPASERVILRLAPGSSRKHVAGALRFDWEGNLWVTVADNESRFTGANTNTLLGKILRIKPKPFPDSQSPQPGRGTTYDVPSGNLFQPGTAGALPEIYVMGVRNPYSLALDPVRKGVAWGDVGPDNFSGTSTNPRQFTEEHNFTTKPGNFGWPYWAGDNILLEPGGGTPESPVNNNPDNDGLKALPPALPAIHPFARAAAITGPIYRFDSSNPSTIKFPPHFNGAWLVADLNKGWVDAVALDPAGTRILGKQRLVAANSTLTNPIDMDMGPDGALYVITYAGYRTFTARTGIVRMEYKGACRVPVASRPLARAGGGASFSGGVVSVVLKGDAVAEVRDLEGRLAWRRQGTGPFRADLRQRLKPGLHILTVTYPGGALAIKGVP